MAEQTYLHGAAEEDKLDCAPDALLADIVKEYGTAFTLSSGGGGGGCCIMM
jgi:hypothetical protein